MTSPFPFPTRYHHAVQAPGAVHTVHFYSLTDPVLDVSNSVTAGKKWRQPDDLDNPTKYKDWIRNEGNTDWILDGAWGIAPYDLGQVPVADADGYLWPGDVEGGSGGGPATVDIQDEGVTEGAADTIDFVGAGVSVAFAAGKATVTVSGGGGGVGWIQDVNENGTTFANFTAVSGTWASDGTTINQTNPAGELYAYLTAKQILGLPMVYEAEVQFVGTSADNDRVGLVIGGTSTVFTAALVAYLRYAGAVHVENGGVATRMSETFAWGNDNNWHKLRIVVSGGGATIYVDSTLVGSAAVPWVNEDGHYIGLYCNATECKFRNIKMWTLTDGLPA